MIAPPRLLIAVTNSDRPDDPPRVVHGRTLTTAPADAPALAALERLATMAAEMAAYIDVIEAAAEARDPVIVSLAVGEAIARARRLRSADIALLIALSKTQPKVSA